MDFFLIRDGSGATNRIFGYTESTEKCVFKAKLNKAFLHIIVIPNFIAYLMIIQKLCSAFGGLHFEKSSNMPKIWQKKEEEKLI